ncbi:putative meiosis specific protein hop1 [Erysiphe neolycopersici]|uniref:Putative meiosis specific protein hop1 n=1 Tax=Erysiphe neolycopersici TaxID=212602 RepID=A0A420HXQ5_9PEZI|nr:putative meiosis specific protein hop1 [Erysiphe neolycopersici]
MPPRSRIQQHGPVPLPTSQIILTQKHSFELMKTVITATISHILWARRVFPNITYNLRSYDPADPEVSYEAFVKGIKGTPKILPRSQDPAVDKVLDCLEIGAADALERGYLEKLQVSLHIANENLIDDKSLIESYTMIFEYDESQNLRISSEINMKSVVIRSAKQDLYGLVNDVGFLIHHNNRHRSSGSELPDEFRMLLSLKYNAKAPIDYQPPMFRPGDRNTINILRSGVPNPNLNMNTGFHRVSIGVHILEDKELIPVNQVSTEVTDINAISGVTSPLVQPMAPTYSQVEEIYTQPDAVKQLQKIGISRNPNSDTQDTIKLDFLNSQKIETMKVAHEKANKWNFLPYTQPILNEIQSALKRNSNINEIIGDLECECKVLVDNESLFNCIICGNLKHVRCYGYLDCDLPAHIVCYTCLLEKNDKDRIENIMKPLAIKRRALFYLREKGVLSSCSELAPHLNIPKYRITRLLGDFKSYGLLKGSRKDKKRAPMATYIGDDEKLRLLYFRPQQEIDHFFSISKSPILPIQDSSCKSPNGNQTSQILGQGVISKDQRHSLPSRPVPFNDLDQGNKQLSETINSLQQSSAKKIVDLIEKTPQICSILGSSTQGTPSPRSRSQSSYTNRDQYCLDQERYDYSPRKRGYATTKFNHGADVITSTEEIKRLRTSKTSPWIIRNY